MGGGEAAEASETRIPSSATRKARLRIIDEVLMVLRFSSWVVLRQKMKQSFVYILKIEIENIVKSF
jgi:hypothetical protein